MKTLQSVVEQRMWCCALDVAVLAALGSALARLHSNVPLRLRFVASARDQGDEGRGRNGSSGSKTPLRFAMLHVAVHMGALSRNPCMYKLYRAISYPVYSSETLPTVWGYGITKRRTWRKLKESSIASGKNPVWLWILVIYSWKKNIHQCFSF